MLSKTKIKYINSLQLKKHRESEGFFIVEGEKSVLEFVRSDFQISELFGTEEFLERYKGKLRSINTQTATTNELHQAGTYKSNNAARAIIKIPVRQGWSWTMEEYTLALDSINDPGNLGTIIRLADWYGIKDILISKGSVDPFSPKVVNSSKGSLSRVRVHVVDLLDALEQFTGALYVADLKGENVHSYSFKKGGVILMGSESHGISEALLKLPYKKITIPSLGEAESLNVAVATGIIIDNIFRDS